VTVGKRIVICLDGTSNQLKAAINTNVVRLFDLLDLSDPGKQVAYYDPGVGTFSSPAAWTPPARAISRFAGLTLGIGLRQNLGEAYSYLSSVYEEGDDVFVFGFSRGAYNARALTGMMDVFGIFRPGSQNLIPYAVSAFAKQERRFYLRGDAETRRKEYFEGLRKYARTHGHHRRDHAPVHFVGLWDTVKAAGTLTRQLRWPFTRQLPHAKTIRHAVSIDECRRPFAEYLVEAPNPKHLLVEKNQDLQEVWFPGVHSDVGGRYASGTPLSDIPLKWMADEAIDHGLLVRSAGYADIVDLASVVDPTGPIHKNGLLWKVLGPGCRKVPPGALIHASVEERVRAQPSYEKQLPKARTYVDQDWRSRRALRVSLV
jgi:uncharacterized protein (DUF2235 family)